MKLTIAVFMGGKSTEHEISCISANQVINALDKNKYNILPIYISKENDFYIGDELFYLKNYYNLNELISKLKKVCIYKNSSKTFVKPLNGLIKKTRIIDVAFSVVHGTNVEDGTLSGFLQMLDLPYTNSNILGSAVGQDKTVMKQILSFEGIPCVDWFYVNTFDLINNINEIKKNAKKIGYPLIIKPANLGSSIGIEIVHKEGELESKITEASKYDFKLIIEKMVKNLKEVNISVMGTFFDASVSSIEEVFKNDELLSYRDKYISGKKTSNKVKIPTKGFGTKGMENTSRIIPAKLTKKQKNDIEKYALKAYKVLGASGVVRIDFLIDKNTGKVYLNEINTIPGSLAFYLWSEKGISFKEECDILIENALKTYREKQKKMYTFDTNILENYKGGN